MNFRVKNLLLSLVFVGFCVIFLSSAKLEGFALYGSVVFMMLVNYFILYWLLDFDVHPQGFLTVLSLPTLFFGAFLLIYEGVINDLGLLYKIASTILFAALQYYLVSAQNIINLSHFQNIGLSQPALVVNHFYAVITFFFVLLAIFLNTAGEVIIKFIFILPVFLLLYLSLMIVHGVGRFQAIYGLVMYVLVLFIFLFIYLSGFVNPSNILLLAIALSIAFHALTVIVIYSFRKVLSMYDVALLILEHLLVGGLLYLSSV